MKFIVGNWKSNKTKNEVEIWFDSFSKIFKKNPVDISNLKLIICPPIIYLDQTSHLINKYNLPLKLGVQNISSFGMGAYTGEINAAMILGFASYAIIGHSERRMLLKEDDSSLIDKVKEAVNNGIGIIYCIQDEETKIPPEVKIAAYEPVWAIGTGRADSPDDADKVAQTVKKKNIGLKYVLYGGSVIPENINDFLGKTNIDGALLGKSSLDPNLFFAMIRNAASI